MQNRKIAGNNTFSKYSHKNKDELAKCPFCGTDTYIPKNIAPGTEIKCGRKNPRNRSCGRTLYS